MTYAEVKDCTSDALGSGDPGSVFSVAIENYQGVTKKAESLIIQAIKYNFPTSFKPYISKPEWSTVGDDPTSPGK